MPTAAVKLGNGWYNYDRGIYTYYDANSGQLVTKTMNNPFATPGTKMPNTPETRALFEQWSADIASGKSDINQYFNTQADDPGYLGGRSNVNLKYQVDMAARAILKDYPEMTVDSARQYANQWVQERAAAGWDANEIEDYAKGAFRDSKNLGEEMLKGIKYMISTDENAAVDPNATGADINGDGGKGSIQDELRMFAGHMMQTVGPDSPQAKRIAELAAAAGNKYAVSSGVGPGGITARGVAGTAARAHTDLQTQREGIGLQALAAAGNQQLTVDQLNTQLQQQNQQAGVLNASGIGGLIGSGVGLVGGLIGTAYSSGAMAPAIPGLMSAGGAAGQAIGGIGQNMGSPQIRYGGGNSNGGSTFSGRNWGTS